jgi:DNA replication protein DnaC
VRAEAEERARLDAEREKAWAERDARLKREETERAARQKRYRQIELWEEAGAPARHRGRQLGELKMHGLWAAAFEATCGIVDARGILVLLGDRGNGKTQCGVELVRRYCLALKPCLYVRCREIGLRVRRAYDPGEHVTEQEAIYEFTRPQLLVVDEVQELATTDFARDTLTYILDCRYGRLVPTVLIANATEDGFKRIAGAAIVDRLREGGGVIVFDWPSFRGQAAPGAPAAAE